MSLLHHLSIAASLSYTTDWESIDEAIDATPEGLKFDDWQREHDHPERLKDYVIGRKLVIGPQARLPNRIRS